MKLLLALILAFHFVSCNGQATDNNVQQTQYSESKTNNENWDGSYKLELTNKDNLKIIYTIKIEITGLAHLLYEEAGEKFSYEGVYYLIDPNKIKILYEDETLFIEKVNDGYYLISGEPIYLINPGNEEYEIKKL